MQNNFTLSVVSISSLLRHFVFEVNAVLVNRKGFLFFCFKWSNWRNSNSLQLPSLLNFWFYSNFSSLSFSLLFFSPLLYKLPHCFIVLVSYFLLQIQYLSSCGLLYSITIYQTFSFKRNQQIENWDKPDPHTFTYLHWICFSLHYLS